jgi:hypothetical protein
MTRQRVLLAGAALLLAGMAQAAAPEVQADPEHPTISQREAPAPTAGDDTREAAGNTMAKADGQQLPADATPVNGGDCDGK